MKFTHAYGQIVRVIDEHVSVYVWRLSCRAAGQKKVGFFRRSLEKHLEPGADHGPKLLSRESVLPFHQLIPAAHGCTPRDFAVQIKGACPLFVGIKEHAD